MYKILGLGIIAFLIIPVMNVNAASLEEFKIVYDYCVSPTITTVGRDVPVQEVIDAGLISNEDGEWTGVTCQGVILWAFGYAIKTDPSLLAEIFNYTK